MVRRFIIGFTYHIIHFFGVERVIYTLTHWAWFHVAAPLALFAAASSIKDINLESVMTDIYIYIHNVYIYIDGTQDLHNFWLLYWRYVWSFKTVFSFALMERWFRSTQVLLFGGTTTGQTIVPSPCLAHPPIFQPSKNYRFISRQSWDCVAILVEICNSGGSRLWLPILLNAKNHCMSTQKIPRAHSMTPGWIVKIGRIIRILWWVIESHMIFPIL